MNARSVALLVILALILLVFLAIFGASVGGILGPSDDGPWGEIPEPPEELPPATGTTGEAPPEAPVRADAPQICSGRVVVSHGKPIAGIVLDVEYLEYGSTSYPKILGEERIETDAEGGFAFEIPSATTFFRLAVDAPPGYLPFPEREFHLGGGPLLRLEIDGVPVNVPASGVWGARRGGEWDGSWQPIDLPLVPGHTVRGSVVDPAGAPIPKALVTFCWDERPGVQQVLGVRADDRGRFSATVPQNLQTTVVAFARDHGITPFPQVVTTDAEEIGIVLGGHRLRIRPTAADGTVVCLGDLRLHSRSGPFAQERYRRWDQEEIVLVNVPPGEYLAVFTPQYPDSGPGMVEVLVPGDGEPVRLDLPPGREIAGIIEGQDVEGFQVCWRTPLYALLPGKGSWMPGGPGWEKLPGENESVDDAGAFRIAGLAPLGSEHEFVMLYARRPGDPRMATRLVTLEELEAGEPLRIPLVRGETISGRVAGLSPPEIPKTLVRASRGHVVQQAQVHPDGTFAIVGLPGGLYHLELRGCGIGYDLWLAEKRNVPAGARDVELNVTR